MLDRSTAQGLKRAEQIVALTLTAIVLVFLVVRGTHAGPLWRDECNLLQLSRMTLPDFRQSFRFDSVPLLAPAVVRLVTDISGTSDGALRAFGVLVAVAAVAAAWWSAATTVDGVPLLFLALIGCNTTFLVWGTTIRGYGLGSAAIVLAFAAAARLLLRPSRAAFVVTAIAWLAAAHLVYFNCALIAAIGLATIAVFAIRRQTRHAAIVAGIAAGCALTYLPYFVMLYSLDWRKVVEEGPNAANIWNELRSASGVGSLVLALVWRVLFVGAIAFASGHVLARLRRNRSAPNALLWFAALTAIIAALTYYIFMRQLLYSARTWYFLPLLCCVAVIIDLVANSVCQSSRLKLARLIIVAGIVLLSVPHTWPTLFRAQSNVAPISRALVSQLSAEDLIVVDRWTMGVCFNWYYHGPARWTTIPPLADHRSHRYDLLKAKLSEPRPLGEVEDAIAATLRSGHHVWIVTEWNQNKSSPLPLPTGPAPDPRVGWNQWPYRQLWFEQERAFLQLHAQTQRIAIPALPNKGAFENVMVLLAEGWRD